MTHLRQLGFSGIFEVIYPDSEENFSAVVQLFDLPPTINGDHFDPKSKARFINFTEYVRRLRNSELLPPVQVGFTAYFSGNPCGVAKEIKIDVQSLLGQPVCRNAATFLNTKLFIYLSNWFNSLYGQRIVNQNDKIDYYDSTGFMTERVADFQEAMDYLKHDPRGQALLIERPGLTTFIEGVQNQAFNLLPVYGWTLHRFQFAFPNMPVMPDANWIGNMLQVITGARHAQLHGGDEKFAKPLIIAVFYDYEEEAEKLNHLIRNDHWGEDLEGPGAEQARAAIRELGLREVFSTVSLKDRNAVERIQALNPRQVLLLSMGKFPKTVFNGLYGNTGANIWPQVREGQGNLNSLLATGSPHIRCGAIGGWELGYELVEDSELHQQLADFYSSGDPFKDDVGFCAGMRTWEKRKDLYKVFGQLLIAAQNPDSTFSGYFHL